MNSTPLSPASVAADPCFPALRDRIIAATGLEYYTTRSGALAQHVADRLHERGLRGCRDYAKLLDDQREGETELDHLIVLLTIGETYFFRHRELFDALRVKALPDILRRNRETRRLRAWSAGCSTGPEAYSLSILLRRDMEGLFRDWNLSILGTDINRRFLAGAAEGRYEEWAFRGASPDLRRDCFEPSDKSWRVLPRFKEGVTFQYHNLVRHPFPSLVHNLLAFDLILCRNTMIYFSPKIAQRIVSQLAECLAPGGWLAVGHAEYGLAGQKSLEVIDCPGATLYRRPETVDRPGAPSDGPACAASVARQVFTPNDNDAPPRALQIAARHAAPPRPRHIDRGFAPRSAAPAASPAAPLVAPDIERIRALADGGDIEAALRHCDCLIARFPLDPHGYFYQALLLDQVSGHEAAQAALGKAIYLDRQFVLAHYYLGMTQHKLGDSPGAVRSLRNVLSLLEGRDRSERLPHAEGMSTADLEELTLMHLNTLENR
jgi:chemotaxis protein methyltransferase CheR